MKLGVHIGYWGLGLTARATSSRSSRRPSAWATTRSGRRRPTARTPRRSSAGSPARPTKIKLGSAIFQMPGAQPGDDGDDRGDARPAVRTGGCCWASARRARRSPRAGTAQRFAKPDAAHARVRRGRAQGAARASGSSSTARRSSCRCPTGPGKALKLTIAPVQERDPDLPGRDRPEQHGAGRRDRRRLDPDAVLARARRASSARCSRRAPRAPGRDARTASTSRRRSTSSSPTTCDAARDAMRPFIALYVGGMGSREKNFYNQLVQRYGFEDAAREVQDLYLDGQARRRRWRALPDELIDTVSLVRPEGRRARAPRRSTATRASARSASRRWRSTSDGPARAAAARGGAGRRLSSAASCLGAFGDPGHAFPMIALGRELARARPRRDAADVAALAARTSRREGMRFAAAPEYHVFPTRERPLKPYQAVVRAARETLPLVARARARTCVVARHPHARARRWPASCEGVPVATLVPHVDPRTPPGLPAVLDRARGCRARRAGRRVLARRSDRVVAGGLRAGARGAQRDARAARAARRWTACTAGSSRRLCARRDVPPARVPARLAGAGRTSSGRCCGSRRASDVELPPGDDPLVLVAPSTVAGPASTGCCAPRSRGWPTSRCACWRRGTAGAPDRAARRARRTRGSSSGCPTRGRCRAATSSSATAGTARWRGRWRRAARSWPCPAAGDMNENAARVDWAGVGVRLPRRYTTPRAAAARGRPGARRAGAAGARARELAAWARSADPPAGRRGLVEDLARRDG